MCALGCLAQRFPSNPFKHIKPSKPNPPKGVRFAEHPYRNPIRTHFSRRSRVTSPQNLTRRKFLRAAQKFSERLGLAAPIQKPDQNPSKNLDQNPSRISIRIQKKLKSNVFSTHTNTKIRQNRRILVLVWAYFFLTYSFFEIVTGFRTNIILYGNQC